MDTGREIVEEGTLISINLSEHKGEAKDPVREAEVVKNFGINGDVHAGSPVKQVSLLDQSEIQAMEERSGVELKPGDFAENLTTEGLELDSITLGTRMEVGDSVRLEVSQIGKKCHQDCVVKDKTGECIMPKKGLFFRVLQGGTITTGDSVKVLEQGEPRGS